MSSKFSLQQPYVVAPLPRPIDLKHGRYVVGDVYGGAPGAKKRKRSELAVGIDGEGVNLYDISSSRLITSYALPPQSSFTCPPSSLRTRISKKKVERRTYVSTIGTQAQITLFRDFTEGLNPMSSSTATHIVEKPGNSVVSLNTTATTLGPEASPSSSDLIVVRRDGEIQCLDGETLQEKWVSPPSALVQGQNQEHLREAEIEFVHLTNAYAAIQGIFKGRRDAFAMFPQEISEDGFNPDLLILISRIKKSTSARRLHLVALPRKSSSNSIVNGSRHSVQSLLFSSFIPEETHVDEEGSSFNIQVSSGTLQQLHRNTLTTFNLTETGPKENSSLIVGAAESFLRLSNTSVIVSSNDSLSVYSPKYQSILATIEVDISNKDSSKRKRGEEDISNSPQHCHLVSYFPKIGTVLAIADSNLIAVQVDGHQDRLGRPRAAGLLIDSIGRAAPKQKRSEGEKKVAWKIESETMAAYLPGSIGTTSEPWAEQIKSLESAFSSANAKEFDELIAKRLRISGKQDVKPLVNGATTKPTSSKKAPEVDRCWIMYALSKIFDWNDAEVLEHKLSISFYPPTAFLWLLENGHVTVANVEAALRINHSISLESVPAGELVNALVEINPDMDLLLALLGKNYLGAADLLFAIRVLMESLEMLGDNLRSKQRLLTNGEDSEHVNGDIEEHLEKLEAEVENDLELAEYQLGPGSGVRGQALSLALSKLYICPTNTIVHALQTTFTSQEIVCLIYLLRFELARGAWTSRYLDTDQSEFVDDDAEVPGSALMLITSLLNNCIDAIGAGGWLAGDARLVKGDPFEAEELIGSLKLEVSAALEGIEEATYLKGLTSEMIRYGDAVQRALPKEFFDNETQTGTPARKKRKVKPITLQARDEQFRLLPMGLKAEQQITRLKVGAGGEVTKRTARDIGNLKKDFTSFFELKVLYHRMAPNVCHHAAPAGSVAPQKHPLDPLASSEIILVSALLKSKSPDQKLHFKIICIIEPPKAQLREYLQAERKGDVTPVLPRRASALYYHRGTSNLFTGIVNVDEKIVENVEQLASHFHGQADMNEIIELREACLKHPKVIEAIERYKLPNHLKVVCDTWPYGRDSDDHLPRYVQCYLFAEGEHPGSNHYDIPLPFSPVLDMTTRELVDIIRLPTGADSTLKPNAVYEPHPIKEYHHDLQTQPARTDLKPLVIHQPQGVSFSIDGYLIQWQKWRFRLGFNWREGMILHDVTYDGRELFHRLSLSEMFVPYGDPRMPYSRKSVFDVGDIGAGATANNLSLGCDCLGIIKYFSFVISDSNGKPFEKPNAICMHEIDDGIGWKHTNTRTGSVSIVRSRVLVLQTIITVGNYEYIFMWHLDQAAGLHYRIQATGILSTAPIDKDTTVPWGTNVNTGVIAPFHQHVFSLRIDPNIDGPTNTLVEEDSIVMPWDEQNPYGVGPHKQMLLAHSSSYHALRAKYALHPFWVTSYSDSELYAAGDYTYQSHPSLTSDLSTWVGRKDDTEGRDIVVWHSICLTHNPRLEDYPVMPCDTMVVSLKPSGFFDGNPALDVPQSTQGTNKSQLVEDAALKNAVEKAKL